MIPYLKKQPMRKFSVKELSGGVNFLKDAKSIGDGQLSDGRNVWFHKGALITRPALENSKNAPLFFESEPEISVIGTAVIFSKTYELEKIVSGNRVVLRYVSPDDVIPLFDFSFQCDSLSALAFTFKGHIYLLIHSTDGTEINDIYLIKKEDEGRYALPQKLENRDFYVPLVLTNCWACYSDSGKEKAMIEKGASVYEGFNLLSDRYRMQFSMYDANVGGYVEVVEGDISSRVSYMEYGLPYTTKDCDGDITLEYYDSSGAIHCHRVSCPSEKMPTVENSQNNEDGLYLHAFIKGDVCHITLNSRREANNYVPDFISISQYVNNNMTVEAPRKTVGNEMEKVCAMQEAIWYGNTSLGINGGSRLFLGGNLIDDALVLWSDFEKPLYFPENNYAYVGDRSQRVTAFKKQGANLVIFKENEIYSTCYSQGDILSSQIPEEADITTRIAYFPMILIHPSIGCKNPKTIELCRNRLVFLSSDGSVCTISENNQYSERNVYVLSETVSPKLEKENLENAFSADWCGNYILFSEKRAYLMNYNTYGYVNIHSYTEESLASGHIPWFLWNFPQRIGSASVSGDRIMLRTTEESDNIFLVNTVTLSEENEEDKIYKINSSNNFEEKLFKIPYMIETKHFDFSEPHRNKIIEKVRIAMIKNKSLTVEFISNKNLPDRHSAFLNTFIPYNRLVRNMGIRLMGEGKITLSSLEVIIRNAK